MTSQDQPIPAELAGITALPAAGLTGALQQQAAAILAQRRLTGVAGPLLGEQLRPKSIADAFSLQQQVAQLLAQPIAGWKCLLPAADKIVVAPIYQGSVCRLEKSWFEDRQSSKQSSATLDCLMWPSTVPASAGLARVEPELAFIVAKDLPPRQTSYREAEVNAAIGATHLALELIQSRFLTDSGAGYFDQLADGLFNQGLLLGPEIKPTANFTGCEFPLQLTFGDGRTQHFAAVHPNQQPRAGLYWLVNFLSANGITLQAGQAVITGSYAGVLDLPFDANIQFQYGDWGQFMVNFVLKSS